MKFLSLQEASFQIALAEAREEAREEIREAREKAREKAREAREAREALAIVARKMLAEGIPVETIKKCTDLDESFILSLVPDGDGPPQGGETAGQG
ncbi:MAG: hypothetical protein LBF58_00925 [Deltaproteobacteria bacterium]|jgi:uncharacterized membrane protein|nr:hypothetical protein [Deltaproteobacteria bacterium]